uniref:Uncharacterized protein n=1 Tax=Arundo donax TaxID=35708 RepID=A0A0A8XZ88_ARUDO
MTHGSLEGRERATFFIQISNRKVCHYPPVWFELYISCTAFWYCDILKSTTYEVESMKKKRT